MLVSSKFEAKLIARRRQSNQTKIEPILSQPNGLTKSSTGFVGSNGMIYLSCGRLTAGSTAFFTSFNNLINVVEDVFYEVNHVNFPVHHVLWMVQPRF